MITIMLISVEVQIAMRYKRIENLSDHLEGLTSHEEDKLIRYGNVRLWYIENDCK